MWLSSVDEDANRHIFAFIDIILYYYVTII